MYQKKISTCAFTWLTRLPASWQILNNSKPWSFFSHLKLLQILNEPEETEETEINHDLPAGTNFLNGEPKITSFLAWHICSRTGSHICVIVTSISRLLFSVVNGTRLSKRKWYVIGLKSRSIGSNSHPIYGAWIYFDARKRWEITCFECQTLLNRGFNPQSLWKFSVSRRISFNFDEKVRNIQTYVSFQIEYLLCLFSTPRYHLKSMAARQEVVSGSAR